MKRGLALFDFDGTITTHDTLFEVIKFFKGNFSFWVGMVILLPDLVLYKLNLVSDRAVKEKVLNFFFNGVKLADFQKKCDDFCRSKLPSILRKEAMEKIAWHKQNNDRILVVSASAENWIAGWCRAMELDLIGTQLEVADGKITGRLASANCNGVEKINRIKGYLKLTDYATIYAYGNSSGDKPMLSLAEQPFYKKF